MSLFDEIKKYFQPPQQTNYIPSILPPAAIHCINNGQLPQINTGTLFLSQGEKVHYIEHALLITEKNLVTGYRGGSSGWSFRVFRGVSYRIGQSKGTPIRENVQEKTKGTLYITNMRIVFVARKYSFDKKIGTISALKPYSNGLELQIGNNSYSFLLPDGVLPYNVMKLLNP